MNQLQTSNNNVRESLKFNQGFSSILEVLTNHIKERDPSEESPRLDAKIKDSDSISLYCTILKLLNINSGEEPSLADKVFDLLSKTRKDTCKSLAEKIVRIKYRNEIQRASQIEEEQQRRDAINRVSTTNNQRLATKN
ncbi:hypothetical protein K9N08_00875 [Candidatus Gracilibacteria bacterium]|nr:hypothetical protein [Candidatus Gracilibacteria bacterium]MCF7856097.1 hypothetical protein [Candidatus Gracilibacteria bacterium]MCF7896516.1 hypothetical protein [Candidatus Gracilibacteria bacterium]